MSHVLDYGCESSWRARRLMKLSVGATFVAAAVVVLLVRARRAALTPIPTPPPPLGATVPVGSAAGRWYISAKGKDVTAVAADVFDSPPGATLPTSGDVVASMFLMLKTQDLTPTVFTVPTTQPSDGGNLPRDHLRWLETSYTPAKQ